MREKKSKRAKKQKPQKTDTICLMKEITMMIDSTKMNILNSNIAHHHPLHHLLNTVLEFDQNDYHIELIQKFDIAITQTILQESLRLHTCKRGCYDL